MLFPDMSCSVVLYRQICCLIIWLPVLAVGASLVMLTRVDWAVEAQKAVQKQTRKQLR